MRLRIGIVANENFDPNLGRLGGFGWVAMSAATALKGQAWAEPTFLLASIETPDGVVESHGVRTLSRKRGSILVGDVRRLAAEELDLLLLIDWRPEYRRVLAAKPRTPVVLWVQDPRTPYDNKRIQSLTLPNANVRPAGVADIDCTSWATAERSSRALRRPYLYAAHAHYLEEKIQGTYGVAPREVSFLADPLNHPDDQVLKPRPTRPSVVFLGRLDPIKRPWLFVQLARRFPEVDFIVLGQSHFAGPHGWQPQDVPSNVQLRGHVGEEEKATALSEAWVCINTSIHEALPISFLEALGWRVPLLAAQDPDEVVSRFGLYVGRSGGDGTELLPRLEDGLRILLTNDELRERRASAGRQWVTGTHTASAFRSGLRQIATRLHRSPDGSTDAPDRQAGPVA